MSDASPHNNDRPPGRLRWLASLTWLFIQRGYRAVSRWPQRFNRVVRSIVLRHRASVIVGLLIFVFTFVYMWPHIVIRVQSGEAGVLYRLFGGGTVTDHVYPEGIHIIMPWNKMFIYNVRVQEQRHDVALLTKHGLELQFELSVRYFPEPYMVGTLHKHVGPDYVEQIVIPQVVSVLRTHVGQSTAEEVYRTKRAILERIFAEAIEQLAQNYITVDQVIIRTIELPPEVQTAVEEKITQLHIADAYEYKLLAAQKEAKRLEIEAEGYKIYNETISLSLTPDILKWKGIEATKEIAKSENSKVIVIGNGDQGLPIILGADR